MIERLATVPRLLVACDFDGTLAPIVDDPDAAAALPESLAALDRLARAPGTEVAIVSGRLRRELVERFGEGRFILVGEHGADSGRSDPVDSESLTAVRAALERLQAEHPDSRIEHKTQSVVLHYRQVTTAVGPLLAELRRIAAAHPDLEAMEGKAVFELSLPHDDKGDVILALGDRIGADSILFLGDDVTDERAFTKLGAGDLGIKVGPEASAASVRLGDPREVAQLLTRLADRREGGA